MANRFQSVFEGHQASVEGAAAAKANFTQEFNRLCNEVVRPQFEEAAEAARENGAETHVSTNLKDISLNPGLSFEVWKDGSNSKKVSRLTVMGVANQSMCKWTTRHQGAEPWTEETALQLLDATYVQTAVSNFLSGWLQRNAS